MQIRRLRIQNLRIIESADVEPAEGINVIAGGNGAGKTSILEAIYLAGRGRSFRHADAGPMIRQGSDSATVVAELFDERRNAQSIVGIRREKRAFQCRIDGVDVLRRSTLAEALPVQWISSQPQLLLSSGPDTRRRFLDMGLFHVEHSYLREMAEFQRVLKQRNAAIRTGNRSDLMLWNAPFAQIAMKLDERRSRLCSLLNERIDDIGARWKWDFGVELRYRSGWPTGVEIAEALRKKTDLDFQMGYTTVGPQRAELEFISDVGILEKRLSRGQQKLLVLATNFALMDLIASSKQQFPVLLLDDLPAELDIANREKVMQEIANRPLQAFVTVIEKGYLPGMSANPIGYQMFHVEHGSLKSTG